MKIVFEERSYPIDQKRTVFGRDGTCNIVLEDESVSGFHAEILNEGDRFELVDLGSTNGTFLDGQRVQGRVELRPWQRVRFGDVECEVVDTEARRPTGKMTAVSNEAIEAASSDGQGRGAALLILVSAGSHPGKLAIADSVTVGRAPDCELCLEHEMISGHHARFERHGDGFELVDLQSTNGCFVNGARVQRHSLRHGDRVAFDEIEYRFLMSDENPGESVVATSDAKPVSSLEPLPANERTEEVGESNGSPTDLLEDGYAEEAELPDAATFSNQSEIGAQEKPHTPLQSASESDEPKEPSKAPEPIEEPEDEATASPVSGEGGALAAIAVDELGQPGNLKAAESADRTAGDEPTGFSGTKSVTAEDSLAGLASDTENGKSGPRSSDPVSRVWHFIWRINILRPSVRILRWLIILATVVSALVLFLDVILPAWSQHPVLGMGLFVGLALLLWFLFAVAMVVPDVISIVMRVEQSCAMPAGQGRGGRYPALRAWSGWLRLLSLAWLGMIASLVLLPLMQGMIDHSRYLAQDELRAWLVGAGVVAAFLTGGYLFWKRFAQGGWGSLGLLPVVWLAVGSAASLMWYEGLFHLALPLVSSGWLIAGMFALVALIRTPMALDTGKIWQFFAVVFLLVWVFVLRGEMLLNLARLPTTAIQVLADEAAVGMLFEFTRELGAAWGLSIVVLSLVLRAFVVWLSSDFLRSVTRGIEGLSLRLGHAGSGGIHARFVTLGMRLVTILALGLCLLLLFEPLVSVHSGWYFDSSPNYQWGLPSTQVGTFAFIAYFLVVIWAYRELLLASYDLRAATARLGREQKPMDMTSLRVVYGFGMLFAAVGGAAALMIAARFLLSALDGGGPASLLMALAVLAGSGVVILLLTLPLIILRNLLDLEAHTRPPNSSAVTVNPVYPSLSTVAGIGKFMAVLVLILAMLATGVFAFFALMAERMEALALVLIIGLPVSALLYWLISLIPDLVRLLLTLERNLCQPRSPVQQYLATGRLPEQAHESARGTKS